MKLAWGFNNHTICVGATVSVLSNTRERPEDIALASVYAIAKKCNAKSCVYNEQTDTIEVRFPGAKSITSFSKIIKGISS